MSQLPSVFSNSMLKTLCVAGALAASTQVSASSTDFFGYIRAHAGVSEKGASPETFGLPGVAKYRLGNENNWAELGVKHQFDLPEGYDGKNIEFVMMLADGESANEATSAFYDNTTFVQSYIKFDNFLGEGISAWGGRRFYKRMDIHMNDYFWLNTGAGADGGLGIEGIDLAGGKFSFASFVFKNLNDAGVTTDDTTGTNFDFRLEGIEVTPNSNINFWLYGAMKHAGVNGENESGLGIGGWVTTEGVMGGSNTTAILYKDGAASNGQVVLDSTADFDNLSSFEINNNLVIEPNENYSLQWGVIYKVDESAATNGKKTWMSTGVRPVFYMTDHTSVAVELGYDNLDDETTGKDGSLTKATVALQLAKSRGYYSRPVMRAFVTAAEWDEDFSNNADATQNVGGVTYAGDTSGWAAGLQVEAWW